MRLAFSPITVALAVGLLALASPPLHAANPNYHHTKTIKVGGEGGWDYLAIDATARRLYVSHGTKVVVIDIDTEEIVDEFLDTPGVHGIAVAHGLGRCFISNGKENTVSIVNAKTSALISKVTVGENPDAILFEPKHAEVYAFNGGSRTASVIDAKTGTVTTTIPLAGKPEFAAVDPAAGRVFVNIEDKNEISVIDSAKHEVIAHWPVAPGESPSGLAIDVKNHHLFAGCENKLMLMIDSVSGKVLGSSPIGDGVDANAIDPATQFAFASCRDGTTTVARAEAPDKLTVVQTVATARGARTMALDPVTHKIYLSTADYDPATLGERRPKALPDTFKVLVFAP